MAGPENDRGVAQRGQRGLARENKVAPEAPGKLLATWSGALWIRAASGRSLTTREAALPRKTEARGRRRWPLGPLGPSAGPAHLAPPLVDGPAPPLVSMETAGFSPNGSPDT